ncbi:MAG TPA: DUF1569 domain-containing protein [Gemmatimonadales bacterium]|nr:DUF1569 domain-containing protein [Gemmatimonadales bacterium]
MTHDSYGVLQDHHQAVEAFLTAARAVSPTRWSQPRAPGKWSPGQVVEHVALAYEVNRQVLHGHAPPMSAPRWLRPLIRTFLLGPVLRRGRFIPGSKSPRVLRPRPAAAVPADLLARLAAAMAAFETDAAAVRSPTIDHPFFGRLPLGDFVRLQEIHTRHHGVQLSPAAG